MNALPVPGATLHFQVEGSGPVLLLSQSGEGDADRTADLVPLLADAFTVVTYDRRGLSRSTLDPAAPPVTMADHADDVARLLAEVADGPALMAGFSMGAAIGLRVAARHPGVLGTLIAHEPVLPNLLPAAGRAEHVAELAAIQRAHAEGGWPRPSPRSPGTSASTRPTTKARTGSPRSRSRPGGRPTSGSSSGRSSLPSWRTTSPRRRRWAPGPG
ncbi:alpha/beta fold hydrolase [Actinomadura sp. ATCC 39365]